MNRHQLAPLGVSVHTVVPTEQSISAQSSTDRQIRLVSTAFELVNHVLKGVDGGPGMCHCSGVLAWYGSVV